MMIMFSFLNITHRNKNCLFTHFIHFTSILLFRCDPEEKGYAFYEDFLESCGLEEVYRRNNEVGSLGYILIWKVAGEKHPSSAQSASTM